MNKYYECIRCGLTVQGFEASLSVEQDCVDEHDHAWIEVPGPYDDDEKQRGYPAKGTWPVYR